MQSPVIVTNIDIYIPNIFTVISGENNYKNITFLLYPQTATLVGEFPYCLALSYT